MINNIKNPDYIIAANKKAGKKLQRLFSFFMGLVVLFSYVTYMPAMISVKADMDPTIESWKNELSFGELGKTFPGMQKDYVTLTEFRADNGDDASFILDAKYKSAGSFDPSKYKIIIENDVDLLEWSKKCFQAITTNASERYTYLSAHYVLGNNINYPGTVDPIIPIGLLGSNSYPLEQFSGQFDGQGFEISNLRLSLETSYYYLNGSNPYFSMFSNLSSTAVVENLGIRSPQYTQNGSINIAFKAAGIVGYNRGIVRYCYVLSAGALHTLNPNAELSGVIHTNAATGTVDNCYFAGVIKLAAPTITYAPVVFLNETSPDNSNITNCCYDSTASVFNASVVPTAPAVTGVTTAVLKARTGVLRDYTTAEDSKEKWYTTTYTSLAATMSDYPRLCGFKITGTPNITTNPYSLKRPADIIYMRDAIHTVNNARLAGYRIDSCIDMGGVSPAAYTTPTGTGTFQGRFTGTIQPGSECGCVGHADHPGDGSQLSGHCLINFKMNKAVTATVGGANHVLIGMFFSSGAATSSYADINFVGGGIKAISPVDGGGTEESTTLNKNFFVGMLISRMGVPTVQNVHTSADVSTVENSYTFALYMGGLVGASTDYNSAVTFRQCSNSGSVDGGTHRMSATSAPSVSAGIGGLIGTRINSGSSTFEECVNYGDITGAAFGSGLVGNLFSGGIIGYSAGGSIVLDRLLNKGTITNLRDTAPSYPLGISYVGGIFGFGMTKSGAVMGENETRMVNEGQININPTATGTIYAGGVLANCTAISGGHAGVKRVVNRGNIVIDRKVTSISASGIGNGQIAYYECYNYGKIISEGETTKLIFDNINGDSRIAGINAGSTSYYNSGDTYWPYLQTVKCENYTDFDVTLTSASAYFFLAGIASNNITDECVNNGNLKLDIAGSISAVGVAGIRSKTMTGNEVRGTYNSVNNGNITVTAANHTNALSVAGISLATTGESANNTNNGAINVTATDSTQRVCVSGCNSLAYNNNTNLGGNTSSQTNCVNNGPVNVNVTNLKADLHVGGIQAGTLVNCSGSRNNAPITVNTAIQPQTATTTLVAYISGLVGGDATGSVADSENTVLGKISYDAHYTTPAANALVNHTSHVSGVSYRASNAQRNINHADIEIAKNYDFNGRTLYVAGVIGTDQGVNSETNFFSNNQNFGDIYNTNNVGDTRDTSTTHTVVFSGITRIAPPYTFSNVNHGDITMTVTGNNTQLPTQTQQYIINGILDSTKNIDNMRTAGVTSGIFGLSNTGNLKFNCDAVSFPTTAKLYMSGVLRYPGVGRDDYIDSGGDTLPVEHLSNSGNITANVAVSGTYPSPTASRFNASETHFAIGGISAMPGYYTPTTERIDNVDYTRHATSIPMKSCANLGDILFNCSGTASAVYNIGGIAGTTMSNSTPTEYTQKLKLFDCVNGGTVKAVVDLPSATNITNANLSGVGGIAGFMPQRVVNSEIYPVFHTGIYNCVNFGTVQGGYSTGGIVGCEGINIYDVINFGDVFTGANGAAGGIIGAIRSYHKGSANNSNSYTLNLENAINYGNISGAAVKGGIIGFNNVAQFATAGHMTVRNVINASNARGTADTNASVPFIGSSVAQISAGTRTYDGLIDIADSAQFAAWKASYGPFDVPGITNKTVGPDTDPDSIYSTAFDWAGTLNNFAYLTPEKSARNTVDDLDPDLYLPYENGIFGVTTYDGVAIGVYPSANVDLSKSDPVPPNGSTADSSWRSAALTQLGGRTVGEALIACRQIKKNDQADIMKLDMKNNGDPANPIELISLDRIADAGKYDNSDQDMIVFYVIKDNFTPGIYKIDFSNSNTKYSFGATFIGSTDIDLSGVNPETNFDGGYLDFLYTLQPEDDAKPTKDWTIRFIFKETLTPLVLTAVREGTGPGTGTPPYLINSSLTGYVSRTFTAYDALTRSWTVNEDALCTQNNILIFFFDTFDLAKFESTKINTRDRMDKIWLEYADGTPLPGNMLSTSPVNVTTDNVGYYKMPAPTIVGDINSRNFRVINYAPDDPAEAAAYLEYRDYNGKMTVNLRMHSNLPSGNYRVAVETVYGSYYVYFTRELNKEANVQAMTAVPGSSADVDMVKIFTLETTSGSPGGLLACSISGDTIVNSSWQGVCIYGNAPDLSKLSSTYGLFNQKPQLSTGAVMGSQKLISVTDKGGYVKEYLFSFDVTPEAGVAYKKTWYIKVTTNGVPTPPNTIQNAVFNGTPYLEQEILDPYYQNQIFFVNENQAATLRMEYNISSTNMFNSTSVAEYFRYELTRNGAPVPTTEYSVTKTNSGNVLILNATFPGALPNGTYELKAYYYRYGQPVQLLEPIAYGSGKTFSEYTWDNIYYTPFKFVKGTGNRLSHALGLVLPQPPVSVDFRYSWIDLVSPSPNYELIYSALNSDVGYDITALANADMDVHREFNIDIRYKRGNFFSNYKLDFVLPEGAMLYRETQSGDWELVSEYLGNLGTNFIGDREVRYRVYAEDTRYYQDYVVRLHTADRVKKFNFAFIFEGGASNTTPVNAIVRDLDIFPNPVNNTVAGNMTIFSHPTKSFITEWLPGGDYLMDIFVPYGYETYVVCGGSDSVQDYVVPVLVNGKPVSATSTIFVQNNETEDFTIEIHVRPISGFYFPWGVRHERR